MVHDAVLALDTHADTTALPTHRAIAQRPPLAGLPSVLGEVDAPDLGWVLLAVPLAQVKPGALKGELALLGAAPSLALSAILPILTAPQADTVMFRVRAGCTQALSSRKAFDEATLWIPQPLLQGGAWLTVNKLKPVAFSMLQHCNTPA